MDRGAKDIARRPISGGSALPEPLNPCPDPGPHSQKFHRLQRVIMFSDYFNVQVFFLVFRETLETAVIVSVLLAFLRQGMGEPSSLGGKQKQVYNALFWQVWAGAAIGLGICVLIGALIIFVFYFVGTNLWDSTEKLWESIFSILASVMISWMGIKMLKINKLKKKWRVKLARLIVEHGEQSDGTQTTGEELAETELRKHKKQRFSAKYMMAILPMITTLREGLEAIMFIGGLGTSQPGTSFPLAVLSGIGLGSLVGLAMYRYGEHVSIQVFLTVSTCFLYLVAAGLFSRGVWFWEVDRFIKRVGGDVTEQGSGPGSYDISRSVWHVNCCNPETDGPWMIFNALLGWQNSATYASVSAYILYWAAIVVMVTVLRRKEKLAEASNGSEGDLLTRATQLVAGDDHDEGSALLDSSS